ncbi:MAG: DnaJ domain-containing protein [Desulfobacteraceae bacterium]|nr:DnaJ domain-containing protein [Desulfobacteraceae bacterium]
MTKAWRDSDPWKVLGLIPGASHEEIKQAYRRLARLCHPDKVRRAHQDSEAFFRISAAYEQLIRLPRAETVQGQSSIIDEDIHWIEDGAFFFLNIQAREAFFGLTKNICVTDREAICPECGGSGRIPGTGASVCAECGGVGHKALSWGDEDLLVVCTGCSGTGYVGQPRCPVCRGRGRVAIKRVIKVNLPRGIKSGTVLRLPEQGPWRADRRARDPVFVEVRVEFPEGWSLCGLDIHARLDIDIWSALSGGMVPVPVIDGSVLVDVPPGLAPGDTIVLSGRGWIRDGGERGDFILAANPLFPKDRPPEPVRALIKWLKAVWPAGISAPPALPSK